MIVIVGAGKWGQAISKLLGKNKHALVDVDSDGTYSADTVAKIKKADKIILCVPSSALADCCNMLSGIIQKDAQLLSCTKGLFDDLKTPSEVIRAQISNPVAALSGPNLSTEIMEGKPAMTCIAGDYAHEWAKLFSSPHFPVLVERDSIGLEFGGAIKNVVALGCGLLDGYYAGAANASGAFIAFMLLDIEHLYHHKSNSPLPQTPFISDLIATSLSEQSRNHSYGHECGTALRAKKSIMKPILTVEGYHTLHIVKKYIDAHKIPIPVISALYDVFYGKGTIEKIIASWQ